MPRALIDYQPEDWRRLRPLLHPIKDWQVRRASRAFCLRPPRRGDLDALREAAAGADVMVTIAFNDPEILERQILAVRRFVSRPAHVIADNSSLEAQAGEIEDLCRRLGAPYVRLPPNPWGPRSPSRSHGAALDWVYRRLIRPARPAAFGFLDHDLAPLGPDDPFLALQTQPVAGDKRWVGPKWYLWAGYCFFRFEFLDHLEPDFGQDWSLGLDTGGANWSRVYARLDPGAIAERPIERLPIPDPAGAGAGYAERRGVWLHEVGLDTPPELRAAKRAQVLRLIDQALSSAPDRGPP